MGALNVVPFYDGQRARQLEDAEVRNQRVVSALEFADEVLVEGITVLDVGCGIGWTSAHLRAGGRDVTGLDISPVLIETARDCFGGSFVCADFAIWMPLRSYDAVVMIDVYEHFARGDRPLVHATLRNTGAHRIVLTLPTVEAQDYARANGIPLQPIDENVTEEDLAELAAAVRGRIEVNRLVSIWRDDDYRHVLVTR